MTSEQLIDQAASEVERDTTFLISRDLKKAAATLSDREARYLVDAYYQAQEDRIRNQHQVRAATAAEEPHAVLSWFEDRSKDIEASIKGALHEYAKSTQLGQWCLSIHGIGPVVTAGLLAHIDIKKAPTAGHIWRFAGLDPTAQWLGKERARQLVTDVLGNSSVIEPEHIAQLVERGPFREETLRRFAEDEDGTITRESLVRALSRQPWNASLKRLSWIIGGLFVRLRKSPKDVYGKVYEGRKALELAKNDRGDYRELALRTLEERNITDKVTLATYRSGKLPLGRIEQRARRYAAKLFLAHFQHVAYELHYGKQPPRPYVLDHMNHVHFIAPPNWPMVEKTKR